MASLFISAAYINSYKLTHLITRKLPKLTAKAYPMSNIIKLQFVKTKINNFLERLDYREQTTERKLRYTIRVLENNIPVKNIIQDCYLNEEVKCGLAAKVFLKDYDVEKFLKALEITI